MDQFSSNFKSFQMEYLPKDKSKFASEIQVGRKKCLNHKDRSSTSNGEVDQVMTQHIKDLLQPLEKQLRRQTSHQRNVRESFLVQKDDSVKKKMTLSRVCDVTGNFIVTTNPTVNSSTDVFFDPTTVSIRFVVSGPRSTLLIVFHISLD